MKKIHKRVLINIIQLVFLLFLSNVYIRSQDKGKELVILHTNDLHSRLMGFSPEADYSPLTVNDDNTRGGFARIAGIIQEEKKANPESILVLDAGDFLMGTFFHALEESRGFQLPLMYKMGYDAICLGNHEFDYGIGSLSNIIQSSLDRGTISTLFFSNIEFNEASAQDDQLEAFYKRGVLKKFHILEKNGLRIGLLGIMGYDASYVAPNALPAKFIDPVKTAKKISKQLKKEEGVDLVICLSHSGVTRSKKGEWEGEDVKLAKKAKYIDIIISGHSHTILDEPIIVNGIPIVQTGAYGCNIGRLHLVCEEGRTELINYALLPVDDAIAGDPNIHQMINKQKQNIRDEILKPLDINYDSLLVESSFDLICNKENRLEESNLGPFLADALRYYVNRSEGEHTDVTIIAAGVIRDSIRSGKQGIPDLFRVVSLGSGEDKVPGYPLSKVYVMGRELKQIIEILLVAYHSSASSYCYYSGLRVYYDPDKGLLRKVKSIELGDEDNGYREINLAKKNDTLYGIVANAYMLKFIGLLKKKSLGLVNVIPKDLNGHPFSDMKNAVIDFDPSKPGIQEGKEWLGLYHYVSTMPDTDSNGIPDIPEYYKEYPKRLIPEKR